MVEAATATKSPAAPGKAKASTKKPPTASKKPATKATHPATSQMVNAAVGALKERKGVSLQAIKKYIAGNYIVDVEHLAPFIKKYIKQAVEKNILVQISGVGAAGRFKLAGTEKKPATKPASEEKAKKTTTKPPAEKNAKKTTAKTAATSKNSDKPLLPSKAKKSGKAPAAKTKSPKTKTIRN